MDFRRAPDPRFTLRILLALAVLIGGERSAVANVFRPKACAPEDLAEFHAALEEACPCASASNRREYRACARRAARLRMKEARGSILRVCNKTALRCIGRATCGVSGAVTCSAGAHVACIYTGRCTDDPAVSCTSSAECAGSCDFAGVAGGVCADDPGTACLAASDCSARSCSVQSSASDCASGAEVGTGTCCVFD